MVSMSAETVARESRNAPLRFVETDPEPEEGVDDEQEETDLDEGAVARSLTWKGYAALDAEGRRKMSNRLWSLWAVGEPRVPSGCQKPSSGE